jgi:hypothetical protein
MLHDMPGPTVSMQVGNQPIVAHIPEELDEDNAQRWVSIDDGCIEDIWGHGKLVEH